MKILLIVVGVLFLLLAVVSFLGAIVVFFVARGRQKKAAPAPVAASAPQAMAATAPAPSQPIAVAAPPRPPAPPVAAPAHDPDGTMMVDSRKAQVWGALHATAGLLAGRVFPIDPNGFYIGRDRGLSHVVIELPSVSKRHVWIGVRDGAVLAIDQKSTNGTFLNDLGTKITEARLNPEDTIILSDDAARFTYRL